MISVLPPPALPAPAPAAVRGVVLGRDAKPLAGARVEGGGRWTFTDAKGTFSLPVPEGTELQITAPGFDPQTRAARGPEALVILLQPTAVATVEVTEGSGYSSQEGTSSSLGRMEVYTTPGAAADVFQAVKGLPGVSQASEGAELYVRGGSPQEVGIYLNGGRLARPFHHPNAQGGIFTAVDTALVTSVTFVPGGFSARYGDALSAVLDLSTEVPTPVSAGNLILAIPTQGVMAETPAWGGALRGSARRGSPDLLDRWYGLAPSFQESPESLDTQAGWQRDAGPGRFQATVLVSKSHLGVDTRIANQVGLYTNRARSAFGSLQWRQTLGATGTLLLVASRTAFHQDWTFGPWGIKAAETTDQARAETTFLLGPDHTMEGGLEGARLVRNPEGQVPLDLSDWRPDAPARTFAYRQGGRLTGAYLTWRWQPSPRLGLSLGGRADRYVTQGETTRDLRGTLSFLVHEGVTLRASWGRFHQAPSPDQLDPHAGNPDLRVQRATHALVALDAAWQGAAAWNLRLEAYRKDYDRLVVDDSVRRFTSTGRGAAEGVDLFLKARRGAWQGWLGYGYLDSRRREGKQPNLGPVPTSIPHNLTAVGLWMPRPGWQLSAAWRSATGAPVTPILGGLPLGDDYRPVEGPAYSDRLPAYGRMDARLTRLMAFGPFRGAAFLEVMNLLNRHNAAGYSYSRDFTSRRVEESFFSRRILVAGVSLGW